MSSMEDEDTSSCSCSHSETGSSSTSSSSSCSSLSLDGQPHRCDTSTPVGSIGQEELDAIFDGYDGKGSLFYLSRLDDDKEELASTANSSTMASSGTRQKPFSKMRRFRSSYSRLAKFLKRRHAGGSDDGAQSQQGNVNKAYESTISLNKQPEALAIKANELSLLSLMKDARLYRENNRQFDRDIADKLVLLYLAMDNTSEDSDLLLYSFPAHAPESIIGKLKGMFITLNQVVAEVTGQQPLSTQLMTDTTDPEEPAAAAKCYQVSYTTEFAGIMVVAVLDELDCSVISAQQLAKSLHSLICFLFGSLTGGFRKTANHLMISQLLSVLAAGLFTTTEQSRCQPGSVMPALTISDDELLLHLNEMLTEYEAMEWLGLDDIDIDGDYEQRLQQQSFATAPSSNANDLAASCLDFVVVGSALLYRGHLIATHLPDCFRADISTYLSATGIVDLSSTEPVRFVNWLEVFPLPSSSCETAAPDYHQAESEEGGIDHARYFLLVVCERHTLLVTLFEMPFVGETTVMPNRRLVSHTLQFVLANLNRAGLMAEVGQHLAIKRRYYSLHLSAVLEGSGGKDGSSGKLSSKLRSLSLREFFQSSPAPRRLDDSIEGSLKSVSSPSLPQVATPNHHHHNPNSSSLSVDQNSSIASTACNNTEYSSSFHSFSSLVLRQNVEDFRHRLPHNLLLYSLLAVNSKTHFGTLLDTGISGAIVQHLNALFRRACIQLRRRLDMASPNGLEYGHQFTMRTSSEEMVFWVCCRRDVEANCELYACFRASLPYSSSQHGISVDMESLCHRLLEFHNDAGL